MKNNNRVTIRDVYNAVEKLEMKIEKQYVHRTEFIPIRSIVYGMVGLLMTAVFTAVVAQVVKAGL